jgi:apolipoprotein D and lipocalin family protein
LGPEQEDSGALGNGRVPDPVDEAMKRRAKILAIGGIAAAGLAIAALLPMLDRHPVGNAAVPQPAKGIELSRYLGRWYEIARYEQRFQKGCQGVTADYSLRQDGNIDILNRCREADGEIREARGTAKVVDKATNAKLKVSFFGPFTGDYWVLDHADDYSWSIVGESSGRYLWILAREATPGEAEVEELIHRVEAMGYDISMLVRTTQP